MKDFGSDVAHVALPEKLDDAIQRAFRSDWPVPVNVEVDAAGSPSMQCSVTRCALSKQGRRDSRTVSAVGRRVPGSTSNYGWDRLGAFRAFLNRQPCRMLP